MIDVVLRQFGMGMASGVITEWHKNVGDRIEKGEPFAAVEAAKSNIEVPSPATGLVVEILFQVESDVPVNTVIARILEDAV